MTNSTPAAPPTPQEIQRKLSVHTPAKQSKSANVAPNPVSGTESDSDSIATPDLLSPTFSGIHISTSAQQPLSSIAERRSGSGEDTEDEDDEEEGGWKTAEPHQARSIDESVIKAGYLWKKGERRKTWKKRWFVLRPAHLAYYKTSAEYQLLRLLELSEVHSCTQVALKRHENTFGLISPKRTFYLQAKTSTEVQEWVIAIEEARQTLLATSTQNSATSPIPIPTRSSSHSRSIHHITPSPPSHMPVHPSNVTSSDSEDASPQIPHTSPRPITAQPGKLGAMQDPTKTILSGYLMKCGSKRKNWKKRWFVLTGEKLVYYGSHMDTKPHRQIQLSELLDTLEYDLPAHRNVVASPVASPAHSNQPSSDSAADGPGTEMRTFKIIATKRTLLLCAPNEEDEIRWMGAIRALIARRSDAGVVPGEKKASGVSMTGGTGEQISELGSGGIKGKVPRRMSVSGSSGNAASGAGTT